MNKSNGFFFLVKGFNSQFSMEWDMGGGGGKLFHRGGGVLMLNPIWTPIALVIFQAAWVQTPVPPLDLRMNCDSFVS